MCPHNNVWPGAICCCLLLIKLATKKYDFAHLHMDIYIPTKFQSLVYFSFLVTLVEGEEEDEQNSLS